MLWFGESVPSFSNYLFQPCIFDCKALFHKEHGTDNPVYKLKGHLLNGGGEHLKKKRQRDTVDIFYSPVVPMENECSC